jgi:formylglycine-generating enzyme required for sulfatase activity
MDPKSTSSAEWSDGHAFTSPAGTFQPNAFGLCDMLGNVFEWCDNWQKGNENVNRVTKGGAFITPPIHLRAPRRMGSQPNDCHYNLGFRVVCECKAAK